MLRHLLAKTEELIFLTLVGSDSAGREDIWDYEVHLVGTAFDRHVRFVVIVGFETRNVGGERCFHVHPRVGAHFASGKRSSGPNGEWEVTRLLTVERRDLLRPMQSRCLLSNAPSTNVL